MMSVTLALMKSGSGGFKAEFAQPSASYPGEGTWGGHKSPRPQAGASGPDNSSGAQQGAGGGNRRRRGKRLGYAWATTSHLVQPTLTAFPLCALQQTAIDPWNTWSSSTVHKADQALGAKAACNVAWRLIGA